MLKTELKMLPIIEIHISKTCKLALNLRTGKRGPIGDSYWFEWDAVLDTLEKQKMNVDSFLTLRLAHFLTKKKPKSNILIFYAPTNDRFVLTVCSRRSGSFLDVLHSTAGMPGYLEYGQDHVPPIAHPFLFYTGREIYRVYEVGDPEPDAHYVCDFGNLFGLTTSPVAKEEYDGIRSDVESDLNYSPVPEEPVTEVEYSGTPIKYHHAFCRVIA